MKAIKTRSQESVTVDIAAVPIHDTETMCRTLIGCVNRLFEDSTVKVDYERWKQERKQRKE